MSRHSSAAPPGFLSPPVFATSLEVWQKLMAYIQACPVEINGFGMVDHLGDTIWLDDVFILDQTAHAAGVEVSAEALNQHMYKMLQEGQDPGNMRFQWHSHVNMEAYFSATAPANIENYGRGWMISFVANKRGEYRLRLDMFEPFRAWTPLELRVNTTTDDAVMKACKADITAKVRQPSVWRQPKPVTPHSRVEAAPVSADNLEVLWGMQ